MAPPEHIANLDYSCRQYGAHSLQRVAIWQASPPPARGRWIVYIHGGAWRDPRVSPQAFAASVEQAVADERLSRCEVRGYASIDYRLSRHPEFAQDAAETPATELRCARHPDHILDIRAALGLLQAEYQLSDDYVLVGHSAGATLALQLLMGEAALAGQPLQQRVPLPAAVVGMAGIYDLVGLNARRGGAYAGFMAAAFGDDEAAWREASPARYGGSFRASWPGGGRLAVLAHSRDDSLVDRAETDAMAARLARDGVDVCVVGDLTGEHDFVWRDGSQVVRLVGQALARLQAPDG